jgi:hypothetical protein
MANPMGKTRKVDAPYLIVTDGDWEYRVLKANTTKPGRPGATWYCAVKSPMTRGTMDLGDTYIADIHGVVTFRDPVVTDEMLPAHLGGTVKVAANPLDALLW